MTNIETYLANGLHGWLMARFSHDATRYLGGDIEGVTLHARTLADDLAAEVVRSLSDVGSGTESDPVQS